MNICVYGASSNVIDEKYIKAGEELGLLMARAGHTLVFGGGASGLMGAVARGMKAGGGRVIGVAPSFFNVDGILFEGCDEFIYTETMRERKERMEKLSDAFIMTAGGIGTFEEFFEILTLRQLGRHKKPIAILNTDGYFDSLCSLIDHAIEERFMTEANRRIFSVFGSAEETLKYLASDDIFEGDISQFKSIGEK